jgi:thiol-disulfide isomerase/thioredoxin
LILRRSALLLAWGPTMAVLCPWRAALAATPSLPVARALDEDLARAVQQKKPLIVMVSLEGCPFCKMVRDSYLPSVQREQKLMVVQLDMHNNTPVKDALERQTTHAQLIKDWGVNVAPTLLFLGPDGSEIASRLVGAGVPDFYDAYLQERIDQALQSFK